MATASAAQRHGALARALYQGADTAPRVLRRVYHEAALAGLPPAPVLALIHVESA
ncbi:MAG TPA: hypothetical protein VK965_07275 [Halomonas sp.]|nr:hypothetical protein [Halomonas sp.]